MTKPSPATKSATEYPPVGVVLPQLLASQGVEIVFGIPGVHTVELYRGLPATSIRHITPRHEQGAGFMADGYARVSGKPGVAFLITGPGLTNCITAMAQAAEDSIPILVISGVNRINSLGHGRGLLHELLDQKAVVNSIVRWSHTLLNPDDLGAVIERAFALFASSRPGPVHIEIPTDVMKMPYHGDRSLRPITRSFYPPRASRSAMDEAVSLCKAASLPLILAGGGAVWGEKTPALIAKLAERLDAPVVQTTNARGIIPHHPLRVPASPSLPQVRQAMSDADLIIALGTEFGTTDYDAYEDGLVPTMPNLIRIDIDAAQMARGPAPRLAIMASVETAVADLVEGLGTAPSHHRGAASDGAKRAATMREAAHLALSQKMRSEIEILEVIKNSLKNVIIVGDSTQPVYAGNLYFDADRPRGWFNSATGYGTLGYAPGAAIGAALADPDSPIVCLVGDGGIQFSLAELGSAVDAKVPVIFIVWNSEGYLEIENFMVAKQIKPEGVKPMPPDFMKLAAAFGIASERVSQTSHLAAALQRAAAQKSIPYLIEMDAFMVGR